VSPLTALIIGLLQGVIEWLPISSQGNLVLIMVAFLRLEPDDALILSVYLHLGTGLAALTYFERDIRKIFRMDSEPSRRLLYFLLIATALTGLVGLPLFLFAQLASIYGEALLWLTGIALISTGVIEKSAQRRGDRTSGTLNPREGILLGLVQALSAVPGASRSGLTTSSLLLRGFSGEEALRISFLMSIPAVFAAAIGLSIIEGFPPLRANLIVALAASFFSALLSINLLLRAARKLRFWSLCMVMGMLTLLALIPYLL